MTLYDSFLKQHPDTEEAGRNSIAPEYWETADKFTYVDDFSVHICFNSLIMYLKQLEDRIKTLETSLNWMETTFNSHVISGDTDQDK